MTMADYLRSQRTLTEAQVRKAAQIHDANDLRPSERATYSK